MDHIGVLEIFRFRYNGQSDNGQIFVRQHEEVKTGAVFVLFVLMLAELLLDLSLLWRLELLLNHWRHPLSLLAN